MKLSDILRAAGMCQAATPVGDPGDLRKLFPKIKFKGWTARTSKPNELVYSKGTQYTFSIKDAGGYPEFYLTWPQSLGEDFIPSGHSWAPKKSGQDKFSLTSWSDAHDWPGDIKLLQKITDHLIQQSSKTPA
jgi:hypothetical protein